MRGSGKQLQKSLTLSPSEGARPKTAVTEGLQREAKAALEAQVKRPTTGKCGREELQEQVPKEPPNWHNHGLL